MSEEIKHPTPEERATLAQMYVDAGTRIGSLRATMKLAEKFQIPHLISYRLQAAKIIRGLRQSQEEIEDMLR